MVEEIGNRLQVVMNNQRGSTLIAQLAHSFITGENWLGFPIETTGPVVWLQFDMAVEESRRLIEFLGRYQRTVDSGLRIILPFVQTLAKVDMREQVVDVPPQEVITRDNVSLKVNAVVYYRVLDPIKCVMEIEDYHYATSQMAQTTLRSIVGQADLAFRTGRTLITAAGDEVSLSPRIGAGGR